MKHEGKGLVLLVGMAVSAVLLMMAALPARCSQTDGTIAFVSGTSRHLYSIKTDGTNKIQLTSGKRDDEWPAWSPDGRRIVLSSYKDNQQDLYIVNSDGSGEKQLTSDSAFEFHPSWSPDGKSIVYVSRPEPYTELKNLKDIYTISADGLEVTRLTHFNAVCSSPVWLPDGSGLLFSAMLNPLDSTTEIYRIDSTGGNLIRLTNSGRGFQSFRPLPSPDGKKILFESVRDHAGQPSGVYVMNVDGSAVTRFTDPEMACYSPSWSPNGRKIIFVGQNMTGQDKKTRRLFIMNSDGSNQTEVANGGDAVMPAWTRWDSQDQ